MKKRILLIVFATLMIMQFCACGSSKSNDSASSAMAYATEEFTADYAYESGSGLSERYAGNSITPEEPSSESGSGLPVDNSDKIIYSANVTLETMQYDETLEGIDSLIKEYKCYIESSSTSGANLNDISRGIDAARYASYTIRVPADSFDKLLNSLSTIGNVPYKTVYTENVSAEYYDSQARLNNYKSQEERLVELLKEAKTVSDVIEIEDKLTDVRYNIESIQTRLNSWDNKVAYSTLYLSVEEVSEYVERGKVTFGQRIKEAFSDGFEILEDFIVFLISALPLIVLLAVLTIIVIVVIKKIKKSRKSKQATEEKKSEE